MKGFIRYIVLPVVLFVGLNGRAEVLSDTVKVVSTRSMELDSTVMHVADSVMEDSAILAARDTLRHVGDTLRFKRNKFQLGWHPESKRAMWLGMVIPCGGQIYNRKFWKVPIFLGGIFGCIYAINWNAQMLSDYSQAYQDLVDDDPTTKSYEEILPIGYDITGKEDRIKTLFKDKKDYYRRYRDLSIFCVVAVYALSIIDAYVDAELSTFDISRDLTLHWQPTFIRGGNESTMMGNPGLSFTVRY